MRALQNISRALLVVASWFALVSAERRAIADAMVYALSDAAAPRSVRLLALKLLPRCTAALTRTPVEFAHGEELDLLRPRLLAACLAALSCGDAEIRDAAATTCAALADRALRVNRDLQPVDAPELLDPWARGLSGAVDTIDVLAGHFCTSTDAAFQLTVGSALAASLQYCSAMWHYRMTEPAYCGLAYDSMDIREIRVDEQYPAAALDGDDEHPCPDPDNEAVRVALSTMYARARKALQRVLPAVVRRMASPDDAVRRNAFELAALMPFAGIDTLVAMEGAAGTFTAVEAALASDDDVAADSARAFAGEMLFARCADCCDAVDPRDVQACAHHERLQRLVARVAPPLVRAVVARVCNDGAVPHVDHRVHRPHHPTLRCIEGALMFDATGVLAVPAVGILLQMLRWARGRVAQYDIANAVAVCSVLRACSAPLRVALRASLPPADRVPLTHLAQMGALACYAWRSLHDDFVDDADGHRGLNVVPDEGAHNALKGAFEHICMWLNGATADDGWNCALIDDPACNLPSVLSRRGALQLQVLYRCSVEAEGFLTGSGGNCVDRTVKNHPTIDGAVAAADKVRPLSGNKPGEEKRLARDGSE
jgi:hypothetical protein